MVVEMKICKQHDCIMKVGRDLWSLFLTSRPTPLLKAGVATKLDHVGEGK